MTPKSNLSLKKEIKSLKDESRRIATAFKSHESSCGGHNQRDPEMEKSPEFIGAEYDDLKGIYVAVKKDLKALGEGLNFLSARDNEMTIEIDNLVQHSFSFNGKLAVAGVPECAEPGSKESAIDTTELCVCIFEALGFNDCEVIERILHVRAWI